MRKNILYAVILALFLAGGIFSLANCADDTPDPAPPPQEVQNGGEANGNGENGETNGTDEAPAAAAERVPHNITVTGENSFVGIAQNTARAHASELTFEDVDALVREAVALVGGLYDIVSDGDLVVLKPNLVTMNCNTLPGWRGNILPPAANGNTTDYRVTRVVAQMVRELNPSGRIYVMEGSAQDTMEVMRAMNFTPEHIPEVDGFFALESASGGWREFDSPYAIRVYHPNPLLHDYYYFNRKLFEADVLINLPTLKNHWDTVVTGSIKNHAIGSTPANLYGIGRNNTNRGQMVPHGTPAIHRWMADYYTLRPVDFIVMDALQGLEHGPTPSFEISGIRDFESAQKNLRSILASRDSLAIDVLQTNIINWDPESVLYLELLREAGEVGNGDTERITLIGNARVDDLRSDFAGRIPPTGGRRLTAEDTAPPSLTLSSAEFDGAYLVLELEVCERTNKLDIFIDGAYVASVIGDLSSARIYAGMFDAGARDIRVYSFTRFMSHAVAETGADK